MRPSSESASFNATYGNPVVMNLAPRRDHGSASASSTPTSTNRRRLPHGSKCPRLRRCGFGSTQPTTTRRLRPHAEDRVDTRRRSSVVVARLERDVERRLAGLNPSTSQRRNLGVLLASTCVVARNDHSPPFASTTTAPTGGLGDGSALSRLFEREAHHGDVEIGIAAGVISAARISRAAWPSQAYRVRPHELVDVAERSVNACETHVRDLVQFAQMAMTRSPSSAAVTSRRSDLAAHFRWRRRRRPRDPTEWVACSKGDRSPRKSLARSNGSRRPSFLTTVGKTSSMRSYVVKRFAVGTLAATTITSPVPDRPGVDDLVLQVAAERALHVFILRTVKTRAPRSSRRSRTSSTTRGRIDRSRAVLGTQSNGTSGS
jgi:hypothetical protein